MFFWTPYSFVRIVLFFLTGILLGIYQPDLVTEDAATVLFLTLVVGYFIFYFVGRRNRFVGGIGLLAILIAGFLNTLSKTESRDLDHFINHPLPIERYKVVINSHSEDKEKSWKAEAEVLSVYDGKNWIEKTGNVLLYFSKKEFSSPYQYGDELLINIPPQKLKGPSNPGEFDYKRFLTFRKIYHQQFLRKQNVLYVGHNPSLLVMDYSIRARVWAEQVLKKYVEGEQERAVAYALILGIKDGLDNDLVQAYSSSGAMHVLAVSGLHVGIIYMIFLFVMNPLKKYKSGKWILAVASILALWSYAFITGLSPSVLRAVTMFSFLAAARPMKYSTNIYNTLAVSAFCLLMWEPYLIMSVGFQLSYMAVIGIVYLQPKIYRVWEPTNWLLDKVWQITCVSIAAQLATFTLGILYFHQFPVYFFVSNLFVIPGAIASLCLGILLLAVSVLPPVALVVGNVLEAVLSILNYLVFAVERLPFSLIENIYISTFQSWLLLGLAFSLILLLQFRKFEFVVSFVACGLLFGLIQWQHYYLESAHPKFIVYQVNGHSAIEWVDKGKSYFFADSTLVNDRERLRFHIRPNRLINGVHTTLVNDISQFVHADSTYRLFSWNQKTFLQLYSNRFTFPKELEVDYVIVSNNSVRSLKSLERVKIKELIIDSSNSSYVEQQLLKEAESMSVRVYSVLQSGAYLSYL